ncbi:glycosyltransferase [Acinetobacter sp. AND/436]|uniref:glycosyltransferase n=1 Tax=Acinetobacter sp. AND/436 TaxID=3414736 RepID=UPI003C30B3EB
MSILFIGKRFYTNRDAYTEKFGRIYQLPYYWSKEIETSLWLVDYHSKDKIKDKHNSLNILSTPLFSLIFLFNILKTIFIYRPKTIVASGDCYIGLFAYILAKLCRSKFIFDVYDKYDAFSGYRNLGFNNLFVFLLKHADTCFFASKKLKSNSEQLCKKTILVPNGVDTNHFYPRDKTQSRKYFNLDQNKIYVGYFGSMEIERGIDDLITAVKLLRKDNKNIYLLLGGKKRDDLNLEHEFINYLGNVPFKNIPIAMACCDILTLPYRTSEFLDNASSCKISEYIEMGIPIVATKSENNLNHLPSMINHKAIFCSTENPTQLADSIQKQFTHLNNIFTKNQKNTWETISIALFKNSF